MTRLPKSIKIGGLVYQIKRVKDLKNDKGESLWGQFSPPDGAIYLDSKLPDNRQAVDTLVHEILHGIFAAYKLHASTRDEERIVSCVARGLLEVFSNNPKLVSFIQEEVRK